MIFSDIIDILFFGLLFKLNKFIWKNVIFNEIWHTVQLKDGKFNGELIQLLNQFFDCKTIEPKTFK